MEKAGNDKKCGKGMEQANLDTPLGELTSVVQKHAIKL